MADSISTVDLGLPLEAQVLSQFFDQDFVPSDYINALLTTSLNASTQTSNTNALNNKSVQLYSASSLKVLFQRCSSLSLHFNEYTNELAKRFDQSYETLLTTSTQIISYNNNSQISSESNILSESLDNNSQNSNENNNNTDNNKQGSNEFVTRLQYHLATLNASMYTLLDDLKQTRQGLNTLESDKLNVEPKSLEDLKKLVLIKNRIKEVKDTFALLKSIVASSEIDDSNNNIMEVENFRNSQISVSEFKNAISVLYDLMKEQVSKEIDLFQNSKQNVNSIEINHKLVKIIDNMIKLQPVFVSLSQFQAIYNTFVEFLKIQKGNYLNLFDTESL